MEMKKVCAALLLSAAVLSGCKNNSLEGTACGENPCTDANRTRCVLENGAAVCLCNSGYLARPNGTCEEVNALNCPEHGGDTSEPDDCLLKAKEISVALGPRIQAIEPVGDYDYFQLQGTANAVFEARVLKGEGTLLPRVDLFDQSGTLLDGADDTIEAKLTFKTRGDAPYFLRITHSPTDPSVGYGAYTVTLGTSGLEDHGDTSETASAITPAAPADAPVPHYGRLEYPNDLDWFSFAGANAQHYRVTFDGAATVPVLSIYTASSLNAPLLQAQRAVVDFQAQGDGTLFLVVSGPHGASYNFRLILTP